MNFTPLPHQPRMIEWVQDRDSSALFCSPGMGKTVTVLTVLDNWRTEGEANGALIVGPIRTLSVTWPNQIALWGHTRWMRVAQLRTPEGIKAWHDHSADVYLINPEMLPKVLPKLFKGLKKMPVDTIIVDELSLAKNPQSKRFNALRPYLKYFRKRVGLTGTPVPNNYLDLFAQIRLLDDGNRLGKAFYAYRQSFFTSDYMGFKWTINKGAKETIDNKLADLCLVMLGDDYLDVPTCSTEDVEVAMPPEAKAAYKTLEKELLLELEHEPDVVAMSAAVLANKLLQATSGAIYTEEKTVHVLHDAKIKALQGIRKKHGKEPILVLTAYKHEMERVLQAIPGSRKFDERDMDEWQSGRIHTWVSHFGSLSHGIDGIQKSCSKAVWVTLPWSHEGYVQTNARVVRTGQSHETTIYRLITPGTMDEAVCEALRTKSDTESGLLMALKALQQLKK